MRHKLNETYGPFADMLLVYGLLYIICFHDCSVIMTNYCYFLFKYLFKVFSFYFNHESMHVGNFKIL